MTESDQLPEPAPRGTWPISTIVLGVDGSPTARRAAETAAALARASGARLHLVTALRSTGSKDAGGPEDGWHVDRLTEARAELIDLAAAWPDLETEVACVVGKPAEAILSEARRLEADVIVVGNRRMQGVSRVLGAVANDIAHHAPCDVYIVNTVAPREEDSTP